MTPPCGYTMTPPYHAQAARAGNVTPARALSRTGRERVGERGSGTVLVLVVMMMLGITGGSVALVGAAIGVRHRAETAADLAALSGAAALARGTPPCPIAARIARVNGATVETCNVAGAMVNVTVTLQPQGPLARLPPARARAKAGPASAK